MHVGERAARKVVISPIPLSRLAFPQNARTWTMGESALHFTHLVLLLAAFASNIPTSAGRISAVLKHAPGASVTTRRLSDVFAHAIDNRPVNPQHDLRRNHATLKDKEDPVFSDSRVMIMQDTDAHSVWRGGVSRSKLSDKRRSDKILNSQIYNKLRQKEYFLINDYYNKHQVESGGSKATQTVDLNPNNRYLTQKSTAFDLNLQRDRTLFPANFEFHFVDLFVRGPEPEISNLTLASRAPDRNDKPRNNAMSRHRRSAGKVVGYSSGLNGHILKQMLAYRLSISYRHVQPCEYSDRFYCMNGGTCVFVGALDIKTCR